MDVSPLENDMDSADKILATIVDNLFLKVQVQIKPGDDLLVNRIEDREMIGRHIRKLSNGVVDAYGRHQISSESACRELRGLSSIFGWLMRTDQMIEDCTCGVIRCEPDCVVIDIALLDSLLFDK